VNGGQIAAMLVLGASGAVPGTRFVATVESIYPPNQKNAILAAKHSVRTFVFDQMRGLLVWPAGVDGRAIYNKTLEDSARGVDFEEQKKRYSEAMQSDDTSRIAVWSGASVGLINEIVGAEVCIRRLSDVIWC
jgi:nitronate monooxygenase